MPAVVKADPRRIRELAAQGVEVRQIARRLDCTRSAVYRALRQLRQGVAR